MSDSVFQQWKPAFTQPNSTKHPSIVYESGHMASVSLPVIDTTQLLLKSTKDGATEKISDVQLEAIAYAVDTLDKPVNIADKTRGFFLGDGTGVGKSRTIVGILSELYMRNRTGFRAVWISLNKPLQHDAKAEYAIVKNLGNACPKWIGELPSESNAQTHESGVVFTSYATLRRGESFDVLLDWLQSSTNTILIFDEAHCAKTATTKTGKMVLSLQRNLINPRVVYSTATAASDIRQMHYMEKLGLWNEGGHQAFVRLLDHYGSSAMEMAALQLKHSGRLVSRQLGFDGVSMHLKTCELTPTEQAAYDTLTQRWSKVNTPYPINSIDYHNFYQHLITSFKINTAIELTRNSLNKGESVVIGLQTTGESSNSRNHQSCLHDLLNKHNADLTNLSCQAYLDGIYNPIDMIIEAFGSENVAEISGRTSRPVMKDGVRVMETVSSVTSEVAKFQSGRKHIAIVSRSGSAGISLHSSHANASNSRRRHHIVLEPPSSAELLVQQFGRTNRTNSVQAPYYTILATNIPSEIRYFYGITSKLEKLGALTRGDRRASIFKNINFEGCSAIHTKTYRSFMLELNMKIAYVWYKQQEPPEEPYDVSNLTEGIYQNYDDLSTRPKTTLFFIKVLSHLNHFIVKSSDHELDPNTTNAPPPILQWGTRHWSRIWRDICRGYRFRISERSLYCMLTSVWEVLEDCIPQSKSWFTHLNEWTTQNHKNHSDYVKDTVSTILLCQLRPECVTTIGSVPTHLIHNIIPWFLPRNTLEELDYEELKQAFARTKIYWYCDSKINGFLNKLLELPINIQRALIPMLRAHTSYQTDSNQKSVQTVEEHVLANRVKDYTLRYSDFRQNPEHYTLTVDASPLMSYQDHVDMFKSWVNDDRVIHFVQFHKHIFKFGVLIRAKPGSNWKFELWYPSHAIPSRCFLDYQWDHEQTKYEEFDATHEQWYESLDKSCAHQRRLAGKYSCKLTFSVNNAIRNWERSTGKLIKVSNTNLTPDFIGLLIRQSRVH